MSFIEEKPRKRGDRRDGVWVKDVPGLNLIMSLLMPNRADREVYLHQDIDITELLKYLETKNGPGADHKTTLFHCIVTIVSRMINERPKLNRFIQGGRIYERDKITLSFVAKRQFTDHAEESLMVLTAKADDTVDTISKRIVGDVHKARTAPAAQGIDDIIDKFAALPRPILMLAIKVIRLLDFWGKNPKFLTDGDPNYTTVLLSNLGSIKTPSVYHHLNNYGTNSIMVTIGTMRKEAVLQPDGSTQVRDFVDIGATLDESIADGFYFGRSLKLLTYICAHPELLDKPLKEDSGYDYK